jgi:C4-dicarboxylate transporter
MVFATLPPAMVFIGDNSSGEASLCAFTASSIWSSSSIATYTIQNTNTKSPLITQLTTSLSFFYQNC